MFVKHCKLVATAGKSLQAMTRFAIRSRLVALAIVVVGFGCLDSWATAQDNPILRERLEQKILEDLAKHGSEETAWVHEKSVDRQKWSSGKVLGRKIRLASWTEESKSWVWLEDPRSVTLDLAHLAVRDGRLEFSATAAARARFKVWGRIPKLAQAIAGGVAQVKIEIAGSTAIGLGHLEKSKITTFKIRIEDLQFNNDAAHPWEDLAKDSLNDYTEDKNEKLRGNFERAIDRVRF